MKTNEKVASTKDRLKAAMKAVGKKQVDLAKETGLSHGTISRYLSGAVEPRADAACKLASALGVSEKWLWGYDVPKEQIIIPQDDDDKEIVYAEPPAMSKIGNNIRRIREVKGLTQEELALQIGYKSKSTINKIECGINDIPRSKIIKFAECLGTSPTVLMGLAEEESVAEISYSQAIDKLAKLIEDKEFFELFESYSRLTAKNKQIVKRLITDLSV